MEVVVLQVEKEVFIASHSLEDCDDRGRSVGVLRYTRLGGLFLPKFSCKNFS